MIENDESDVFLFRRAVAQTGWRGDVRVVSTSTEARAYLLNLFPYQDRTYFRRPHLILSDYRLAGQTALELVEWIRSQSELAAIPLVVISGAVGGISQSVLDRVKPDGFIHKTADIAKLAASVLPYLP